jgi:Na+-transporting NADH:ubiquinone oxidoreductase subunit B
LLSSYHLPDKLISIQKPMLKVCYALLPLAVFSIYLFGWRSAALIAVTFIFGIAAEAAFTFREGKPVTSAALVTCLIFSLSLPPSLPLWMAAVGIIIGVVLGKMAFGGMGLNIFNPAMVGRCFIYITFPIEMTGTWANPFWGGTGGFSKWTHAADAVTQATPLMQLKSGIDIPLESLFLGNTSGSIGETSTLLILLGAAYIIISKTASWKLAFSCVISGVVTSFLLRAVGIEGALSPLQTLLSGSLLFGAAFVVTEPITGAKTVPGQWIYGSSIGALSVVLRLFSNFPEGLMFSVLLMNSLVPIMDSAFRKMQTARKAAA